MYKPCTKQGRSEIEPAHTIRFPSNHPAVNTPDEAQLPPCRCLVTIIAAPDIVNASAANLGVLLVGDDIGMTGAGVHPAGAERLGVAEAGLSAEEGLPLAEPATDEDTLKLVHATGSESLAVGARVELVHHLALARGHAVTGIRLELGVDGEVGAADNSGVLVHNSHVAGVLARGSWVALLGRRRGGRLGGGWVSLGRRGLGGDLGVGLVVVDNSRGGIRGVVVVRVVALLGDDRGRGAFDGDGLDKGLDDPLDVLNLVVLNVVVNLLGLGVIAVGGSGKRNAGKGGKSEGGTHGEDWCL